MGHHFTARFPDLHSSKSRLFLKRKWRVIRPDIGIAMSRKQKRSPYESIEDAIALHVQPSKHLRREGARPSQRTKPIKAPLGIVEQSNNLSSPPSTQQRMSIEELEQKKMLLPYLDKIEYINVQLRQRGLLPEVTTSTTVDPTTAQYQVQAHQGTLEAKNPKQTQIKGAEELQVATPSSIAKSTSTATRLTRQRSEGQLEETDRQSAKRSKIATEKLRLRYPRLFASIDRARVASIAPRERPINWLLKMIEDVYDGLTDIFILGRTVGETSVDGDMSPRPEVDESAGSRSSSKTSSKLFQTRLVMPYLVRKHVDQVLGLGQLADQECMDLMYNLEVTAEKFVSATLFSMFLREIYDDDTLLFYLFLRHVVQREFELQLRTKGKLAHSSKTGRKFIAGDKVHLVNHPLIPDGSQAVYLTQDACDQIWRQFFYCCEQICPKRGNSISRQTAPSILSYYIVTEKMAPLFDSQNVASVDQVFKWSVEMFRTIPQDIIAQYKYQDDGESLRSLLRLRDTISSDLKIEKLTASYSEHERCLRNMKIELLRLERNNNENNKNRTQIRLAKNQIGLLEQQLIHIQSQISTAENLVDGVWQEVVASSPTRVDSKSPTRLEFSKGSKELPSVLGRFEAYIGRLQRRYDIEVKAAAKLTKPWRKQLEDLQLRMVIKIQRAYRARRKARETKNKAREELHEQIRQREIMKQQEFMERKRQEAMHEKDLHRHQARMIAKREEKEAIRFATQKKQEELVRRMRQEKMHQLDAERSVRMLKRMFAQWVTFISSRKKRRSANRLFLEFQFMKWRHHYAAYKTRVRCATVIQQAYKNWRERMLLRKSVQLNKKRTNLAKRYLQKLHLRHLHRLFKTWIDWTSYQLQLKANFRSIIQRRTDEWFSRWCNYVELSKRDRLHAVLLAQRIYRGRLARQIYRAQQLRLQSARKIQRVYRGRRGRRLASQYRRIRMYQDTHSLSILKRIQNRLLLSCFDALQLHKDRESHIKSMSMRRSQRMLYASYHCFVEYRNYKHDKRAAFLLHQYECAVLIQRNYRRHRCLVIFQRSLRCHRASIHIQRVFRGYSDRKYASMLRSETAAAKKVQTMWRQRQAMKLAEKTRSDGILLAAYKGDFTATKRAIEAGYAYVFDGEWNGILHMAAAAGHKRIVKLCLHSRMDINSCNKHGQTPLHLLLSNLPPPSSIYKQDDEAKRIVEDRVNLAGYMIDHGAWHEAADEHGLTPLLLCAALGQVEAAEMLLERSASVDARSLAGLNAMQLAVEGNHFRALQALAEFGGLQTPANTQDTLQLLHTCAGRGLVDCLRILVHHLAKTAISQDQWDRRDNDGYTPLIYAISNGHTQAVELLLQAGASPDEKDFFGRSPIHFAVCVADDGSPEIVQLLATYDVDVNVKDTDGDAALHISCDRDTRRECTSLLLRHGAFIGANALGNHPTHIAARNGAVETLKLLVEYGADMNIKNYDGKTPLGMARMLNQKGVVQFIKQYFAAEPVGEGNQAELLRSESDEPKSTTEEDENELRPVRTDEEWQAVLLTAFKMGTLAEWTHYVDTETEVSFFACASENNSDWYCTWESPVEFDAALGDAWEVVGGGQTGIALRSRSPPQAPTTLDQDETRHRGGRGIQYFYHNKSTGEVRSTVPPIDFELLQDVVQNSKRHQRLRQKIRKVSADSSASAMEYMRFFHDFEAGSAQAKAELFGAIKIQRHFRARRTKRMVRSLLFENKCAVELQRAFRGRQARKLAILRRYEHACATKIQACWRGFVVRKKERERLRAERIQHRHQRYCVVRIQRLFRGHRARLVAYREKVVQKLGPRGYFAWEEARRRAVVRQTYKVWDEMELPREFPGVYFYCHQVTRSCSWEKPKEWEAYDIELYKERCQLFQWGYTQKMKSSAIRLQASWRARQARISFRLIMKSVQLMKASEREYLEDPTNLVKMGNYVLYLHAILHDYERARPLYGRLMRTMAQRGPDVPFILFSYAIFLYVTQEDDVALVEDMILRGKLLDRQLIKYKMAFLGFFRQSMLQNPHDGESNLNYAACLQWLFEQYDEAGTYYIRAIAANPHKKGSMELFQDMLNRKRQIDKAAHPALFAKPTEKNTRTPEEEDELRAKYDSYEQFRRWQVRQAEEDDKRRRRQYEIELDARNRLDAARKIQARFRRRRAMRIVNRVKGERRLAVSMADLADTKAAYDRVRVAFEKLAPPTSSSSTPSLASKMKLTKKSTQAGEKISKPTSMPITRLEELFGAMDLSLTPEDLQTTLADFRSQFGKMPNVNVMDLTSFAQTHPIMSSKLKTKNKRE